MKKASDCCLIVEQRSLSGHSDINVNKLKNAKKTSLVSVLSDSESIDMVHPLVAEVRNSPTKKGLKARARKILVDEESETDEPFAVAGNSRKKQTPRRESEVYPPLKKAESRPRTASTQVAMKTRYRDPTLVFPSKPAAKLSKVSFPRKPEKPIQIRQKRPAASAFKEVIVEFEANPEKSNEPQCVTHIKLSGENASNTSSTDGRSLAEVKIKKSDEKAVVSDNKNKAVVTVDGDKNSFLVEALSVAFGFSHEEVLKTVNKIGFDFNALRKHFVKLAIRSYLDEL
mgnify:CR=1 FL=1